MSGGAGGVRPDRGAGGAEGVSGPGAPGRTDGTEEGASPEGTAVHDRARMAGSRAAAELAVAARLLDAGISISGPLPLPSEPKDVDFSSWKTSEIALAFDGGSMQIFGEYGPGRGSAIFYDGGQGSLRRGQFTVPGEKRNDPSRPMTAGELASFKKAIEREIAAGGREAEKVKHVPEKIDLALALLKGSKPGDFSNLQMASPQIKPDGSAIDVQGRLAFDRFAQVRWESGKFSVSEGSDPYQMPAARPMTQEERATFRKAIEARIAAGGKGYDAEGKRKDLEKLAVVLSKL